MSGYVRYQQCARDVEIEEQLGSREEYSLLETGISKWHSNETAWVSGGVCGTQRELGLEQCHHLDSLQLSILVSRSMRALAGPSMARIWGICGENISHQESLIFSSQWSPPPGSELIQT